MEFFLTFCSAGRIKLKINTKKQNKISEKSGCKRKKYAPYSKKRGITREKEGKLV